MSGLDGEGGKWGHYKLFPEGVFTSGDKKCTETNKITQQLRDRRKEGENGEGERKWGYSPHVDRAAGEEGETGPEQEE